MASEYERLKLLGEGAFGKAFLAKSKNLKRFVVLKEINFSNMSAKTKHESKKEVVILSQLKHCCIVTYLDSYETPGCFVIVMEYCNDGDLHQKLTNRKGKLISENQIMNWFVQMCLALKHLHDRKILHRDIKAQNVFMTKSGLLKIGDFGIAKILNTTAELALTQTGTPYYLSPEICDAKPYNNKSDIWSAGCILYEMTTLKHPFNGKTLLELIKNIKKAIYLPISNSYSPELHEILSRMLQKNYMDRPDINMIVKLPIVLRRVGEILPEKEYQNEFSHTVLHGIKLSRAVPQPIRGIKQISSAKAAYRGGQHHCEVAGRYFNNLNKDKKIVENQKNNIIQMNNRHPLKRNNLICVEAKNNRPIKKQPIRKQWENKCPMPLADGMNRKHEFLKKRDEYVMKLREIRLKNLKRKPEDKVQNNKLIRKSNQKKVGRFNESYEKAVKEIEALNKRKLSSDYKKGRDDLAKINKEENDKHLKEVKSSCSSKRLLSSKRKSCDVVVSVSKCENLKKDSRIIENNSEKRKSFPNIQESCKQSSSRLSNKKYDFSNERTSSRSSEKNYDLSDRKTSSRFSDKNGESSEKKINAEEKRKNWKFSRNSASEIVEVQSENSSEKNDDVLKRNHKTYKESEIDLIMTGKLDEKDLSILRTCSEPDFNSYIRGFNSCDDDDDHHHDHEVIKNQSAKFESVVHLIRSKSQGEFTIETIFDENSESQTSSFIESSDSDICDELELVRKSMESCLMQTSKRFLSKDLEVTQEFSDEKNDDLTKQECRHVNIAWEGTDDGLRILQKNIMRTLKSFLKDETENCEYFEESK